MVQSEAPSNQKVKFKKLVSNAKIPCRALPGDLGFDLFAVDTVPLQAGQTLAVKTGIAAEFPENWGAIIKARSSQGKLGIDVFGGVVDSGYRGEIIVLLHNANPVPEFAEDESDVIIYNAGDKIAQLVLVPVFPGTSEELQGELSTTERGAAGFGSTGS
jgi:dUTP pyrophosphatase